MKSLLTLLVFAVLAAVGLGQTVVPIQGDGVFIDSSPMSVLGQGFQGYRTGLNGFSESFTNPATSTTMISVDVAMYSSDLSQILEQSKFQFDLTTGGSLDAVSNGAIYQLGTDGYASFVQDGRASGDISLSGWVDILDIQGGSVFPDISRSPVIAVDFYLTEDGDLDHWLFGSIRIDSAIPYTTPVSAVPEPSSYAAIAGAFMLGIAFFVRRRRTSASQHLRGSAA